VSAYFVVGTDTGVGKTLVSAALLRAFALQGKRVVGMKPVAAGCGPAPEGPVCGDVESLSAAGNVAAPRDLVNPYALTPPIAPHIAAQQAGAEIDLSRIVAAFDQLRQLAEVVVVEGVGGFMVPLNARQDTADLALTLGLPVILVVGMQLGCISHALLTAEAISRRGLRLAGWVANQIDPAMPVFTENVQALEQRLKAPLLGVMPYSDAPCPESAAGHLRLDLLSRDR
jgi:dethiobiotin synthetase